MANEKDGLASRPTTAAAVVRLAAVRKGKKKDRTAAVRSARYRQRKAGQAIQVIDRAVTGVTRDASVAPTVTEGVTAKCRDAGVTQRRKSESVQQLADSVTRPSVTPFVTVFVTLFRRLFGLGRDATVTSRSGVDLVTLKRDIQELMKLHQKIA